jgi:predicted Zn finger-like uncharacterized protein
MKFLCPSCKAKYQIADEKVAGRSVRMKCRKCGFMIQVTSALAAPGALDSDPPEQLNEADSSAPPPPPPAAPASAPLAAKGPAPSPAAPASAPLAAKAAAPSPAAPASAPLAAKAAAPSPTAPRVASAPAKSSVAKGAALPAPRPPPGKPVGALPKAAVPAARPSAPKAAPAPSAPKAAAAPSAVVAPVAAAAPAKELALSEVPRDFEGEDEVTRMADAGALAGAFTQAFGGGLDSTAEVAAPLSMPGDEWFVGINGVPVGPIRLSELRSKAASGAVSKESLVWRDGFEDWRPLKTYPELLAIVEEGVSSARASLTPFTPPASEARDVMTAKPSGVAAVDAFAAAASPSAVTGSAVVTDDISGLIPPRRGTSPMVWVAMVIAIALGLTMGFVLFGGQKAPETKIVEKIVEVPAKGSENNGTPVAANEGVPEAAAAADPAAPKKPGGPGGKAVVAPEGEAAKVNPGLKGLTGLSGLGPSGGPSTGGPSGATGGGSQLDGGQIQSTVSRYTGSVKRRCWQPALDARARDAPMTAKVTVTITVGGTGTVQNATTSGDPRGYSGLANCIASSVRSWQFPASGGTTIANVPFVFAGQ